MTVNQHMLLLGMGMQVQYSMAEQHVLNSAYTFFAGAIQWDCLSDRQVAWWVAGKDKGHPGSCLKACRG